MGPLLKMDSETSESNSTSLAEDMKTLSFDEVYYTVGNGILAKALRRSPKGILRGLSGSFNCGELTVIMGQSGAGKSTLMDILAGFRKPTSGKLKIDDRIRNEKSFRRISSYIQQDANMWDMFTVEESLNIAAELKLGNHVTSQQKRKRVEEVIKSLDLLEVKAKVCNLSGGQKKRLSIGLELISDSLVMFLDEPTSGLDSSMSTQILGLLRSLAQQGRVIVATIHQPSAAMLKKVDRLYIVEGGRCAYIGTVPNILPFLRSISSECPTSYNPIDFLIQECSEKPDILVKNSENGRKIWDTMEHQLDLQDIDIRVPNNGLIHHNANDNGIRISLLPRPTESSTSKVMRALKSTYPTPFLKQFCTLSRRHFSTIWRDPRPTLTIIGIHIGMALAIGLLFLNIGTAPEDIMDNFKFIHFSALFLMFTSFSAVTINFPAQIPVARREHFNRWYTSGAYYSSTLVSSLVTQTVCTVTYAGIAYAMTGQPFKWDICAVFAGMLLLVSYVALCVGLFSGVVFNVENGVVFGPLLIMPFIMFSGFFLLQKDAPPHLQWIFQFSFLKHGVTGLMLAIYGMHQQKYTCTSEYCHFRHSSDIFRYLGMEKETFSVALLGIFGTAALIILFSYGILKIRLKSKW